MKTITKLTILLLLVLCRGSFYGQVLKKRITDVNFRYEFYTTGDAPSVEPGRTYYWFRAGAIHNSEFGASGEALNGLFEKFYLSNQLAEKGTFKDGLKVEEWKTWYDRGQLAEVGHYKKGLRSGSYLLYGPDGSLIEKGNFKRGKKDGTWINYQRKDTLFYKNDEVSVKKSWLKDLFKKKTPEEKLLLKQKREEVRTQKKIKAENRKQKRLERKQQSGKQSPNQAKQSGQKPEKNFIQRLFTKKTKQDDKST